jgi:hypothetical protein
LSTQPLGLSLLLELLFLKVLLLFKPLFFLYFSLQTQSVPPSLCLVPPLDPLPCPPRPSLFTLPRPSPLSPSSLLVYTPSTLSLVPRPSLFTLPRPSPLSPSSLLSHSISSLLVYTRSTLSLVPPSSLPLAPPFFPSLLSLSCLPHPSLVPHPSLPFRPYEALPLVSVAVVAASLLLWLASPVPILVSSDTCLKKKLANPAGAEKKKFYHAGV